MILLGYLISIWVVNFWDTFDVTPEPHLIEVTKVEKGEFGDWYDDAIYSNRRLTVANKDLGYIYLNTDYINKNVPSEIFENQSYVVYLKIQEAHSWTDVFKYGSKYDYFITDFAEGQTNSFDAEEIFQVEKVKNDENNTPLFSVLFIILLWIVYFWIIYMLDKMVYGKVKKIKGFLSFNKPSWLELIAALYYLVCTVVFTYLSLDFFTFGSWLFGTIFLLLAIYDLYKLVKEFTQRNDQILLSSDAIIIQDGSEKRIFSTSDVKKIVLTISNKPSGAVEEFNITIVEQNKEDYNYELGENNLMKFAPVLLQSLKDLYKDIVETNTKKTV